MTPRPTILPCNAWWPGLPTSTDLADPFMGCLELPVWQTGGRKPGASLQGQNGPLRLSLVTDRDRMGQVMQLRRRAYRRHGYPELPIEPDRHDLNPSTAILTVDDATGQAIATMRVCFNEGSTIDWSQRIELPSTFAGRRIAFFERLAVDGEGRTNARVKQLLFKAAWSLTEAAGVEMIVVATIAPLNRLFEGIGFTNVFGPGATRSVDWHPARFHVLHLALDTMDRMFLQSGPSWYSYCTEPDRSVEATVRAYQQRSGNVARPAGATQVHAVAPEPARAGPRSDGSANANWPAFDEREWLLV